jgi:hypothetical protein
VPYLPGWFPRRRNSQSCGGMFWSTRMCRLNGR